MKAISEALLASGTPPLVSSQVTLKATDKGHEDSDCSNEEDHGTFFVDMRRRLEGFVQAKDQATITTEALSPRQRRFVHAIARTMGLRHASLGARDKNRCMVIFKDENFTVFDGGEMPIFGTHPDLLVNQAVDEESSHRPHKRQRHQKVENGYPCQFQGCFKLFDRVSERRKHEQAHQLAFTNRFQCTQCPKGFRYPKDLKRHQKVHERPAATSADVLVSSLDASDPTFASNVVSRVPSDTSLTFSSNTVSNDNSPRLHGLGESAGLQDINEPFVLDLDPWPGSFDISFGDFEGLNFDDEEWGEEGMLEMARAKK